MKAERDWTATTLGERIRYARKEIVRIGNRDRFGEMIGVSGGAVGNWERNLGINTNNLNRVARATGVSLDWLLNGKGKPKMGPTPEEELAARIRRGLEAANITVPALANLIGAPEDALSAALEGREPLPSHWLAAILSATPLTADWVFSGDPSGIADDEVRQRLS